VETLALLTSSSRATEDAGAALGSVVCPGDVVVLSGDLGAGKTQLVKGVAAGLGVTDPVTSPTFNLLLVHDGGRMPLYHFDLYRLDRAEQLEDIDYWGVLESDGVSCVEWGDRFPAAMPADFLRVVLHITADEERRIEVAAKGSRSAELAAAWREAAATVRGVEVLAP